MLPSINSYSILYILFAWFLGMCYGFVLLSSAAGQNGDLSLFEPGESLTYKFHSTVLLNDRDGHSRSAGFYIAGDVIVQTVWGNNNEKLIKVELISPQLNIKSRKAPSPDGFIPHSSRLDSFPNKPFYIAWNAGAISKILLPKGEELSLANLKKGIASLLQVRLLNGRSQETDASGHCTATYTQTSQTKLLKTKTNCVSPDFRYIKSTDEIMGTIVESLRQTEYELAPTNYLKSIKSEESHQLYLSGNKQIGNYIKAEQILDFVKRREIETINAENMEGAVQVVERTSGVVHTQETLFTEQEPVVTEDEIISFSKEVDSVRDYLKTENMGSLKPAKAFLRLVSVARTANRENILQALESKKNKDILYQLYDVLGYTQTQDSHEAALKKLHFQKNEQVDLSERYLWALSFASQPNPEIIKDLLKKYTKVINIPDKVKETMILTIASMVNRLLKLPENQFHQKMFSDLEELIINNLEYAKNDQRHVFFRALRNLQSKSTIPLLLNYIKNGTQKEGVLSWKAIKSFDPKWWDKTVLKSAEKSLFQLDRKYDSSSRTLAADILIESQPSDKLLENLLQLVISEEPAYEMKQYTLQRIKMLSDEDPLFKERVLGIIKKNKQLNNYSGLSPRGLSTALKREFLRSPSSNGSLVSIQEIKNGIAKRGTVNVVMQKDGVVREIFSLGIFSGGLSNLLSSDGDADEEEYMTAGMELTVLGTQIRPFVFFEGQGELMGHVWSGTASEKTPALQALILLQDHLEYIRLGSGFIAETNIKGGTSFDLSGKIEISLWNRNAESVVEKSAGIAIMGTTKVDSYFVKTEIEFGASIEPKLNLQTDIDFSSNVHLCMRLTQPETVFRHNVFKIERIPGSKHKLRISKYKKSTIPGKTYSLNKKNNDMCGAIFG